MVHETAVAWLRVRLARTVPAKAWEESREDYVARLKAVCADVNATCDVEALCRGISEAHRSVGRPERRPIGAVVCGDPRGIRWGSPRDPQPKMGIRFIYIQFFTRDPPAEL